MFPIRMVLNTVTTTDVQILNLVFFQPPIDLVSRESYCGLPSMGSCWAVDFPYPFPASFSFSRRVGSFGALTMVIILLGGSSSIPAFLNAGSFGALTLVISSMSAGSSSLADYGGEGSFSLSLFFSNIQYPATISVQFQPVGTEDSAFPSVHFPLREA